MSVRNILIVDDESSVLTALRRSIRQRLGSLVALDIETDANVALERVRAKDYSVVVSDLRMPLMDGLTLLRQVAQWRPQCVRLILTGTADFETAQRAINDFGIFRYLCKPWNDDDLAGHLTAAIEHGQAMRQQRDGAQAWQEQQDAPTPQELERARLEAMEPGITDVQWGPNGEVQMPPLPPAGERP